MSPAYWLDDLLHPWHGAPMTMLSYLPDLTPADWASHHRELQLLRSHLFRDRTPQSLHIVGEPQSIPPSVTVCWYPEPPVRTLLKGGLEYKIHFPGAHSPVQFSIRHWDENRYWLHSSYIANNGATYTRFSLTRPFDRLPDCFLECVEIMKREYMTHISWRR
jgi:hypothetical protein